MGLETGSHLGSRSQAQPGAQLSWREVHKGSVLGTEATGEQGGVRGSDPQGTVMVVADAQSTLAEGTEQASRRGPGIRGDEEWELGEEDEDTKQDSVIFSFTPYVSPFVFNVEPRCACY